ncbi:MAG: ABC transporter substrate-binding protein [Anaerolineales bacterium]|nr:ABC transporter substrate-binding protein [Anaerolineales bacterium]
MNNFRRIIVLLLLVVTLLTSCSKNTASQVDEVKLRLNWQPGAEHVAYYLASEKGYYKDAGMNVEIIVGSGSGDSVKLLATGDVDFSLAAGANVIQGVSSGMPIKVIGVIYQDDPTSFTVLDGKGITKLEDLIGKKIGVALNSSTYPEYLALLKRNGIDQSQVTEVPVNFGIEPLLTGQIDAFPGFLTQIPLQVQRPVRKPLVIP